jgi:hypothetical protein
MLSFLKSAIGCRSIPFRERRRLATVDATSWQLHYFNSRVMARRHKL